MSNELPWAMEAEDAVVATVISRGDLAEVAVAEIGSKEFFGKTNSAIFAAVEWVVCSGSSVDMVTVINRLQSTSEKSAVSAVISANSMIPSPKNLMEYINIVKKMYSLRELISAAEEAINKCMLKEEHSEIVEELSERINSMGGHKKYKSSPISSIVSSVMDDITDRHQNGVTKAVKTGFMGIDAITCGLANTDLVILAGRPSMGKTALALNIAENVAISGTTCLLFSLEMSAEQLVERMICGRSSVNSSLVRQGVIDNQGIKSLRDTSVQVGNLPIIINDTAALSVNQIRSMSKVASMSNDIGLIIVDYIQLMSGKGTNREREISMISGGLKALAKELDVPVLALSQLNRGLENRPDKRPIMSDLRDSGSLEQDADLIMFIYRDEVYNTTNDNPCKGTAEVIIRKQRRGPIGTVELMFEKYNTKFYDN